MLHSNIVLNTKSYVKILLSHIDEKNGYFYHNLNHTFHVFERASYLAYKEGLNEEFQEVIQLSALFHDVGYIDQYDDNEIFGAKRAEHFLMKNDFPTDKIDIVKNIILATIPDKKPLSKPYYIIKDADIDNIGRADFFIKNEQLLNEFKKFKKIDIDKKTWLKNSLKLLENHIFYTKTQQEERNEQFEKNKKALIENLQNM